MQDEGRERKCASVRESVCERARVRFKRKSWAPLGWGKSRVEVLEAKKVDLASLVPVPYRSPPPLPKFHQNQPRLFPVRSLLASIDGEGPSFECFNVEEDLKLSLSLTHTHEHTLSL